MDGYSFPQAARMLQVSRQTVYRHVNMEPDRYTIVTGEGQRRITIQGIGLLREQIKKPVTDTPVTTDSERQNSDSFVKGLQSELAQARHQAEILQLQLDNATARITSLEADKEALHTALSLAQRATLQAQENAITGGRGFIRRLFGGKVKE